MTKVTLEVDDELLTRLVEEATRLSRPVEDVMRERLSVMPLRRSIPPRDQSDLTERNRRIDEFRESLRANGVMIDPEQLKRDIREGRP